jgi:hypothetical protein
LLRASTEVAESLERSCWEPLEKLLGASREVAGSLLRVLFGSGVAIIFPVEDYCDGGIVAHQEAVADTGCPLPSSSSFLYLTPYIPSPSLFLSLPSP